MGQGGGHGRSVCEICPLCTLFGNRKPESMDFGFNPAALSIEV